MEVGWLVGLVGGMEMRKAGWLTRGSGRREKDWLGGQVRSDAGNRRRPFGVYHAVRGSQAKQRQDRYARIAAKPPMLLCTYSVRIEKKNNTTF
jgi:hypothetical protein